ncbi:DUF2812 domain-containing protein [Paenibacillus wenxiniae]|uniref:DUF2812 domain-containing protein n=1 Tax=Paenibacillus wenxiniae TaxID=1636843 RepID=A0ABW4RI03_9BACL
MSSTKRVFRWWWIWQSEKMEEWIEAQEQQGWHLVKVKPSLMTFYFEKGNPRTIRYVFDYQNKVNEDYTALYEDAGWERLNNGRNNWYLWRKSYPADQPDARPEIYSDIESVIQRNDRMKKTLITVGLILVPILVINMIAQQLWQVRLALIVSYALTWLIFVYGINRLGAQNRRLRSRSISSNR